MLGLITPMGYRPALRGHGLKQTFCGPFRAKQSDTGIGLRYAGTD